MNEYFTEGQEMVEFAVDLVQDSPMSFVVDYPITTGAVVAYFYFYPEYIFNMVTESAQALYDIAMDSTEVAESIKSYSRGMIEKMLVQF